MPCKPSSKLVLILLLLLTGAGCVPFRGTIPARTFRPDEREIACADGAPRDASAARWSQAALATVRDKLARGEPAVVSYLGCRAEVLGHCSVAGSYRRLGDRYELDQPRVFAQALAGDCAKATHVVRAAPAPLEATRDDRDPQRLRAAVELTPLSLGAHDLTGTWRGVMRQSGGPYEAYDAVLHLEQHGERVTGIMHLSTIDHVYWGDLRFEGRLEGNILYFADAQVIDDNLGIFLAWCLKGGYLIVEPESDRLEGPWRASMCAPGTLHLEREEVGAPRARSVEFSGLSRVRARATIGARHGLAAVTPHCSKQ